jgi:5'-nucleotidase/UDP-sugar diphosphatase
MTRKAGKTLGVLVLVLGLSALGLAQTKTLTILHTNDTHSALLPLSHQPYPNPFTWLWPDHRQGWSDEFRGPMGFDRDYAGIARMSTLIKKLERGRKNVLALHAGDVFVGSFEFNKYLGYPELKIMENLYDAMSLGNHEFDLGLGNLEKIVTGVYGTQGAVQLPLLCANVDFTGLGLANIIQKSIIKTVDGIKVGIFGLVNEDKVNYSSEVVARFSNDVYTVAGMQAGALRYAGCQVVICLSHLGTMPDLYGLADNVPGIDIIVGGHSHDLFDKAIVRNGKIVVQAGSHGRYLGELMVKVDAGGVKLLKWTVHEVDKTVKPDPVLQATLDTLRQGVVNDPRFGQVYTETVAYAFRDIDHDWPAKGQYRDAPLGNLVADAMKSALTNVGYQVDCVLDALGYTEFGIPAGKVVGNDIMRAVPYGYDPATGLGFKLVVAPLPGQLILGGLEYTVAYVEYTTSLCVQTSGLTFAYDSSKPAIDDLSGLSRVDPMSVKINDEVVALSERPYFYVAMSEQVFNFLNNLTGGKLVKIDTGISEYNAVHDYMKDLRFINYKSEGRVKDTAAAATSIKQALGIK